MRPPVRPPQLRCVFFSSMYLPHLLVLPATFWTSVPFATLSVFPSLICGSCPSGQRFAYSFFQIPSHGGHPCCSAMCFVVAYAHLGLSPIRKRPCWANKTPGRNIHCSFPEHDYYMVSIVSMVSVYSSSTASSSSSTSAISSIPRTSSATLSSVSPLLLSSSEESTSSSSSDSRISSEIKSSVSSFTLR